MTPPKAAQRSPAANSVVAGLPQLPAQNRLHLVPPPTPKRPFRHSLLALWHLLSLDAPTVAALWTWAIARAAGLRLPLAAPAAMFIAVWMLYAADRLLDARPLPNGEMPQGLEERHLFHHRHRRWFVMVSVPAAFALAFLLHKLDTEALHLYALLAALLAGWLLLIHARPAPSAEAHRLPKELAVGLFFPAAVFIPTVGRLPELRLALLPAALLLAAICTLNCLYLYAWEHPEQRSLAHWTTRWAISHLVALSLGIALAAGIISVVFAPGWRHIDPAQQGISMLAACCALSALLLLLLHALRHRLMPVSLRALADLVLLTPALLLPLASLLSR